VAPPPLWSGPRQPRSSSLPTDPPGPGPSRRSGWATGSISTCLSRCGRTRPGAANGHSPGNAHAVPGPGSGQAGPDGVPGLLGDSGIYGMAGLAWTVAARARRQQNGLQRATAASLPAVAAARVGAPLMAEFCRFSPSGSAHALARSSREGRLRVPGLGRILCGTLYHLVASVATGSWPRGRWTAGRGAHHAIPVCWPHWAARGSRSACPARRPPHHDQVRHASSLVAGWATAQHKPASGREAARNA